MHITKNNLNLLDCASRLEDYAGEFLKAQAKRQFFATNTFNQKKGSKSPNQATTLTKEIYKQHNLFIRCAHHLRKTNNYIEKYGN